MANPMYLPSLAQSKKGVRIVPLSNVFFSESVSFLRNTHMWCNCHKLIFYKIDQECLTTYHSAACLQIVNSVNYYLLSVDNLEVGGGQETETGNVQWQSYLDL